MLVSKKITSILLILLISYSIFGQNYKDSILNNTDALHINTYLLDSLKIRKIKFFEYLSEEEKNSPEINSLIYSKEFNYIYKKGLLQQKNWSYAGLDSNGVDHFAKNTVGFKPYSFIYEDYYVYDNSNKLIRIDQNTPHSKANSFNLYKKVKSEEIKINDILAKDFLLSYFTDIYKVVIELNKNHFLEFEIE